MGGVARIPLIIHGENTRHWGGLGPLVFLDHLASRWVYTNGARRCTNVIPKKLSRRVAFHSGVTTNMTSFFFKDLYFFLVGCFFPIHVYIYTCIHTFFLHIFGCFFLGGELCWGCNSAAL